MPQGVKDLIGRRLARLTPEALDTLTLAAVLGCDFDLSTLQVVADDHDPDDVIASLEAAVAAGLVVEDAEEVDQFSFAHVLMRETLYERPIASRRLRLHRRIAEALEEKPARRIPPRSPTTTSRRARSAARPRRSSSTSGRARPPRRRTPTRTRP